MTVTVGVVSGLSSTLNDITTPLSGDTCAVLSDEIHDNSKWIYGYADRNGDGIFNWVPLYPLGSADAPVYSAGSNITITNDVISLSSSYSTAVESSLSNKLDLTNGGTVSGYVMFTNGV